MDVSLLLSRTSFYSKRDLPTPSRTNRSVGDVIPFLLYIPLTEQRVSMILVPCLQRFFLNGLPCEPLSKAGRIECSLQGPCTMIDTTTILGKAIHLLFVCAVRILHGRMTDAKILSSTLDIYHIHLLSRLPYHLLLFSIDIPLRNSIWNKVPITSFVQGYRSSRSSKRLHFIILFFLVPFVANP